mgnify:CR=1 FL=1
MKKSKKFKTFLYLILLFFFVLCFQTIAYSAINSTLNIQGDAYARAEADVRITNFRLANLTNATSHYEEFAKSHIITEVDLNDTSSQITYYVEITNYGSVDIGIFDITGLPDGVNYSIKDYNLHDKICDDTGKCNSFIKKTYELTLTTTSSYSGQVQLNFDFRTYHKVTYTDITNNNYPTEVIDGGDLSIPFKEDLKRVQATSNGAELAYYSSVYNGQTITISNIANDVIIRIKEQVAKLMNGSLTEEGSEICIKDECFYIISNDGTTISMLTKYNLHIGNTYDDINGVIPLTNPTGIQDKTAIGWFGSTNSENPMIGVIAFSKTNYWSNITEYPAYVYNSNSYLYEHVENYKSYLQGQGASVKNARLIKVNELVNLGCDTVEYNCSAAPKWVYSTTYWTGDAFSTDAIWRVSTDSHFYDNGSGSYASVTRGLRPVIEIPVDEIYVPKTTRLISGDLDTMGSEVCIKDECFLTISSTDDTVTMIAEMNITLDSNPKQQDEAGTISYTVSSVQNYLNNYKNVLEGYGTSINNIRSITYDELNESSTFACEIFTPCNEEYQWIYTGEDYWTSSTGELNGMWYVSPTNYGIYDTWESGQDLSEIEYGIRPVITISKDQIDTNIATSKKDLIVFILDGKGFLAAEGMTWQEWGESKYNTFTKWEIPLTFYSTYINLPVGDNYFVCNSSSVSDTVNPSDKIIAGKEYYLESKAK